VPKPRKPTARAASAKVTGSWFDMAISNAVPSMCFEAGGDVAESPVYGPRSELEPLILRWSWGMCLGYIAKSNVECVSIFNTLVVRM
jgi:hypothetical protein